jgi:hypothetical protein
MDKPTLSNEFKSTLVNIIFLLLVFSLATTLARSLSKGYLKESFEITEFLVNYRAGFTRRGLLGEVIMRIHEATAWSVYQMIITLSISSFLVLVAFFLITFKSKGYSWFLLPFIVLLGNPVLNEFVIRKDSLLVLMFIGSLGLILKGGRIRQFTATVLISTGILCHEFFGYICLPIVFLILYRRHCRAMSNQVNTVIRASALSAASLTIPVVSFAAVHLLRGDTEISIEVWESWKNVHFPYKAISDTGPRTQIKALGMGIHDLIRLQMKELYFKKSEGVWAVFGWAIACLAWYYVCINYSRLNFTILGFKPTETIDRRTISSLIIFQTLAILPILLFSPDWGRYLFFSITTSFVLYTIMNKDELKVLLPDFITRISDRLNAFLDGVLGIGSVPILAMTVGFPGCCWTLTNSVQHSAIVLILGNISDLLFKAGSFL